MVVGERFNITQLLLLLILETTLPHFHLDKVRTHRMLNRTPHFTGEDLFTEPLIGMAIAEYVSYNFLCTTLRVVAERHGPVNSPT